MITAIVNSCAHLVGRCTGAIPKDDYLLNSPSFIEVKSFDFEDTVPQESFVTSSKDDNDINNNDGVQTKKPMAGSTTFKLTNPLSLKKMIISNMKKVGWASLPSESIKLRGAHYKRDKMKAPSPESLYELICVDAIHSNEKILDVGEKYDLSNFMGKSFGGEQRRSKNSLISLLNKDKTFAAPRYLIISFLLPTSPPKMGQKADEKGFIVTGYFKLRNETEEILKIISNPKYQKNELLLQNQLKKIISKNESQKNRINGVKLWEKWCQESPNNPEMQKRLKFIPRGDNLEEIGIAGWISKYNGKPMLIKRPGITNFVFSHFQEDRMEIDISLHPLPFMFKQAMSHLQEKYFKDLLMSFGFVIEGREEDELPEVLLGNPIHLPYVKHENVIEASQVFS
jgi:hypothetical protein